MTGLQTQRITQRFQSVLFLAGATQRHTASSLGVGASGTIKARRGPAEGGGRSAWLAELQQSQATIEVDRRIGAARSGAIKSVEGRLRIPRFKRLDASARIRILMPDRRHRGQKRQRQQHEWLHRKTARRSAEQPSPSQQPQIPAIAPFPTTRPRRAAVKR